MTDKCANCGDPTQWNAEFALLVHKSGSPWCGTYGRMKARRTPKK